MLALVAAVLVQAAPVRIDRGRFTAVCDSQDARLATTLLEQATRTDTFPGLPRPLERILIAIASDEAQFRTWVGPNAPEWGMAFAIPDAHRIVMRGHRGGVQAGDPPAVLRHELAHLALHEYLRGDVPRWFDEGYATYAAREWAREDALAANVALVLRGVPTLDQLNRDLIAGPSRAEEAYALSYRAVADLAEIAPDRGLAMLFANWRTDGSLDRAMRTTFGMTLDGFEHEWQQRTRRRYGGLALVGNLTVVGLLLCLILVPLYLARRSRDKTRYANLVLADRLAELTQSGVSQEPSGPPHVTDESESRRERPEIER